MAPMLPAPSIVSGRLFAVFNNCVRRASDRAAILAPGDGGGPLKRTSFRDEDDDEVEMDFFSNSRVLLLQFFLSAPSA